MTTMLPDCSPNLQVKCCWNVISDLKLLAVVMDMFSLRFPKWFKKIPFLLDLAISEFHGHGCRNVIATLGGKQLRLQRGNRT